MPSLVFYFPFFRFLSGPLTLLRPLRSVDQFLFLSRPARQTHFLECTKAISWKRYSWVMAMQQRACSRAFRSHPCVCPSARRCACSCFCALHRDHQCNR